MGQADWTDLTGTALDSSDVARGVASAFTVPTGGGSYVYGYRSLVSTAGFAGKYCNLAGFAPFTGTLKGGTIRAAMKRYSSNGDFAPMIGLIQGTDPASANGYLLGLSSGSSYKVCLMKGVPGQDMLAGEDNILLESDEAYTDVGDTLAAWFHLRLDVLVNPHGEVILNVYTNDCSTISVASPTWVLLDTFIDDPIGIMSDSLPVTDGFYGVFGMYTEEAGSTTLFDHIEVWRQDSP